MFCSQKTNDLSFLLRLDNNRRKLASAYATVSELYLTDLCYEDNAEKECESYLEMALNISDDNDGEPLIDALQTAASFRLSQRRQNEAREYIIRAYNKMKTGCEALAKLVGLADQSKQSKELTDVDAADNLPSFEFRCQTAKLLLECAVPVEDDDETKTDNINNTPPIASASGVATSKLSPSSKEKQDRTMCLDSSINVLGSLLSENDEVPEIWYLLGCAFMAFSKKDLANHYWTKAQEMLTKIRQEMEKELALADMQEEDEEINLDESADQLNMQLQSISCQLEEVNNKLSELKEESKMEIMEE